MGSEPRKQWQGTTDGTPWMQRALVMMYRYLPLRVLYAVMALVVPFYMIFNRVGYKAQRDFFRQRMGYGRWRTLWSIYRNHFLFGQVVLDRFAAFAGKRFRFVVDGQELYDQLASDEKGFVFISAHVGCYELAGLLLNSKEKIINALAYGGESATVMAGRNRLFEGRKIRMVPVVDGMSHLFALNSALDRGEIVSMPADRMLGSTKYVSCDFFGTTVHFPKGPFALANAKEVPLLSVFVMKESVHTYHAFVKQVSDQQQFASELESIVRRYPTQWYNYYDFWKQ